ncbi:MAG: hypothetical protein V7638_3892 [Acidobacteriota bacterium]|jgi:hypothetical protein
MIDTSAIRATTDLWAANCNCGGPQPSPGNYKLDQHSGDCPYVLAIQPIDESGKVDSNVEV